MHLHQHDEDDLDPRRRARGVRTRDFASGSRMLSVPRLHELLANVLVRLGLVR